MLFTELRGPFSTSDLQLFGIELTHVTAQQDATSTTIMSSPLITTTTPSLSPPSSQAKFIADGSDMLVEVHTLTSDYISQ